MGGFEDDGLMGGTNGSNHPDGANGGGGSGPASRTWDGEGGTQQVDAEWLLSLCEGDGFSLQMLNEMMRFEPSGMLGGSGGGGHSGNGGGGVDNSS
jgi:hypothetical protein